MTIKQFIEKAIEGGWKNFGPYEIHKLVLTPEVWQGVGRVEGWGSFYDTEGMPRNHDTQGWYPITTTGSGYDEQMWQAHMHRMIDALAEGKTIEEFLSNLK